MSKKNTANTDVYSSVTDETLTRADVQVGKTYRNNNTIWVYEVKDSGRWIPAITQTFRTRKDARTYVTPLRDAGLNVRIAQYSVTGVDRF